MFSEFSTGSKYSWFIQDIPFIDKFNIESYKRGLTNPDIEKRYGFSIYENLDAGSRLFHSAYYTFDEALKAYGDLIIAEQLKANQEIHDPPPQEEIDIIKKLQNKL